MESIGECGGSLAIWHIYWLPYLTNFSPPITLFCMIRQKFLLKSFPMYSILKVAYMQFPTILQNLSMGQLLNGLSASFSSLVGTTWQLGEEGLGC